MQGLIEKIAVLVLDSSGCVVERFTMQLKVAHDLADSDSGFTALCSTWDIVCSFRGDKQSVMLGIHNQAKIFTSVARQPARLQETWHII